MSKFELVKSYLFEMETVVVTENPEDELLVVDQEENGIKNLVIDCEDPILVLEQVIMPAPTEPGDLYKKLLQWNREVIHGAFVLDEEAKTVIFRDTLQLENLDRNELEASVQALGLALAEYSGQLLKYAGK